MNEIIPLLPLVLSGILGMYLDGVKRVDSPILYWILGSIGMFATMILIDISQ